MTPRKKRQRYKWNAARIATKLGINIDLENWDQVWELLDEHGETSYLYAIYDKINGWVKFGKSNSPSFRLKSIKTGNASELHLLCFCEHKPPFTEREVHAELKEFRKAGEWFVMCDKVQNKIDQMRMNAELRR